MEEVFIINPPDEDVSVRRITKDMAGGFGFDAGKGVILPPLELIYHAIVLKNHGCNVHFYDLQADGGRYGDLFEKISRSDNASYIVLLTIPTLAADMAFIKSIKNLDRAGRIFIKLNVKHNEAIRRVLTSGMISAVLVGETETAIHAILNGSRRDGTAYLENGKVVHAPDLVVDDLNTLPDLTVDFLDISGYRYPLLSFEGGNLFAFQSSRGCPFPCAYYCPYPLIQGTKWRAMPWEKLYRNIKVLVERFKVRCILFRDATFTFDQERAHKFCDAVAADHLKFAWWCETRINCLDEKLLGKMAAAGCRGINLGVETGDDELMKSQGKIGSDIAQLIKIRELSAKFKISLHFLMIVGLPKETRQALYNSFLMIDSLKPESLGVTAITPYPGTQLYRDAVKYNWIVDKNLHKYTGNTVVMRTEHLSVGQIRHGFLLLKRAGELIKRKTMVNRIAGKLLKMYFFLWSRI